MQGVKTFSTLSSFEIRDFFRHSFQIYNEGAFRLFFYPDYHIKVARMFKKKFIKSAFCRNLIYRLIKDLFRSLLSSVSGKFIFLVRSSFKCKSSSKKSLKTTLKTTILTLINKSQKQ